MYIQNQHRRFGTHGIKTENRYLDIPWQKTHNCLMGKENQMGFAPKVIIRCQMLNFNFHVCFCTFDLNLPLILTFIYPCDLNTFAPFEEWRVSNVALGPGDKHSVLLLISASYVSCNCTQLKFLYGFYMTSIRQRSLMYQSLRWSY